MKKVKQTVKQNGKYRNQNNENLGNLASKSSEPPANRTLNLLIKSYAIG